MSDNGDAFSEAASSVKTHISYTSFDKRLLFVTTSPLYSYQRSRGLVIPASYNFVEMRHCLPFRVSFRLSSRIELIHFLFLVRQHVCTARPTSAAARSQPGRQLTPEPPTLVGSYARVAGRPVSPPLAWHKPSHVHGQSPATGTPATRTCLARPVASEISIVRGHANASPYMPSGPRHHPAPPHAPLPPSWPARPSCSAMGGFQKVSFVL
jgi:hypothetical protein